MNLLTLSRHAALTAIPTVDGLTLNLRSFSYEDRYTILPALGEAMGSCGGWLMDRKALSATTMELRFEIQLRSALDLYSALIGAGLEMARPGHVDLTALCTLRKHNPDPVEIGRVVTVRLEIEFLNEEDDALPMLAARAALA